jgi:hypothetical protein
VVEAEDVAESNEKVRIGHFGDWIETQDLPDDLQLRVEE